jgi:hypothetical protein
MITLSGAVIRSAMHDTRTSTHRFANICGAFKEGGCTWIKACGPRHAMVGRTSGTPKPGGAESTSHPALRLISKRRSNASSAMDVSTITDSARPCLISRASSCG